MNQECNYKCPHCIIGHKNEVKEYYEGEYLNFKDFKNIVDQGSDYNCPSLSPQGNFLLVCPPRTAYAHSASVGNLFSAQMA